MPLCVGDKLGPYQILASIGAGGMGEVYRARDTKLKREVAIKVLPEAFARDPERMARFQREAEVLASLNHPNIAHIYGVEDRALVMELVEGETLPGPLPIDVALSYARQIAEALEYAHERGVIHRDLKPANVKVTPEGVVKLLDFGLAKAIEDPVALGDASASPTLTLGATRAGVILGTAAYMSPEQAVGKSADRRSDVFSFGAVLYEMLTGGRAFAGENAGETLASVVKDDPKWDQLPHDTPSAILTLLRRCLTKDRKQRLQAIGEARIALENPAVENSAPLGTDSRPRPRWWALAAGVLSVALAALAFVHFRETPPQPRVVRATILPPPEGSFDFPISRALPAISPDGRRIVFGARNKDGKSPLWIRPVDSLTAQPLPGTDGALFPFWSPNSRFVGFFADGKLKKIDTQGGPPVTLAEADSGRGGSWSPQGVIVFAPSGGNSPLLRVPEGGGATSPVTTLDKAKDETNHKFPWFLPDGRHFLYETQGGRPETIRLASIDSADSNAGVIVEAAGSNAAYANGRPLFLRENTLMAQPFDLQRLATAGEAVPVAEQVRTVLTGGPGGLFSVSASGLLVYQAGPAEGRDQLTWFDRTGRKLGNIGDPSTIQGIEFSPDRKRLGVTMGEGNAMDVWTYDAARGSRVRFTFDAAEDRNSVWSPDGRTIIFDSRRKGHLDIYRRPSDASSAEELLYADDHDKGSTSWSADGKFLLYAVAGGLWVLPLSPAGAPSGEPVKPFPFVQTPFNSQSGKFSPDGRWVAYSSTESQRFEVYVAPFPGLGGKQQISVAGGRFPRWRSDGKEIFYVAPDQRLMAAEVKPLVGSTFQVGQVRPLFGPVLTRGYLYDVSADGQQFLLVVTPQQTMSEPLTLVENWAAGLK